MNIKNIIADRWSVWDTERLTGLENELERISLSEGSVLAKLQEQQNLVRGALDKMRREVQEFGFDEEREEIRLMKVVKPKFAALQLFYGEWLLMESNLPRYSAKQLLNYYLEALHHTGWFFNLHYGLFQYYQMEMTDLDHLYFLRAADAESCRHLPLADPAFGTAVGDLFARFIAVEKMRTLLLLRIREMGCLNILDGWQMPFGARRLRWTGHIVSLAELIYGLYYTGQLNHGQATVKDITRFIEDAFQVVIENPYDLLTDIQSRKIMSTTHLLDKMREAIRSVMDNNLAFKPVNQRNLN